MTLHHSMHEPIYMVRFKSSCYMFTCYLIKIRKYKQLLTTYSPGQIYLRYSVPIFNTLYTYEILF